jgi:hypothetical protein
MKSKRSSVKRDNGDSTSLGLASSSPYSILKSITPCSFYTCPQFCSCLPVLLKNKISWISTMSLYILSCFNKHTTRATHVGDHKFLYLLLVALIQLTQTDDLSSVKKLPPDLLVSSANSSSKYSKALPNISSLSKSELRSLEELKWDISLRN